MFRGFQTYILRRFFRRIMKPITVEEAETKKGFISKLYFTFSLVAFSCVLYQVKQGRLDWLQAEGLIPEDDVKLSPAFQYAKMLGVQKATVVRIKGIEILGTKEYEKETFDARQHVQEEENLVVDPERKFLKI